MSVDDAIALLRQVANREGLATQAELNAIADMMERLRCGWSEHGLCPKQDAK